MTVRGVIVAAGYGTRFLPVTRVVPKELLPIVDRPAVDFVVQEFIEAGITEIVVITSRRKRALEDWFDRDPELEAVFAAEGADDKLARIRPPGVSVTFVRQAEMRGTGHALLQARPYVGDHPFVVAYPDDLFGPPNCTRQLIDAHHQTGGCVLSALALPDDEDPSRYGVLEVRPHASGHWQVGALVEKPPPGQAPSRVVSLGRYLFTPALWPALEDGLTRHRGGEYYHVPAVNALAARGEVFARAVDGHRYDTGTPLGYLQTVVDAALDDPRLGAAFQSWLHRRLDR
jgi:UTP--glucose-1-phosphate uridylyltransferase